MRRLNYHNHRTGLLFLMACLVVTAGCAMQRKLQTLANEDVSYSISLPVAKDYQAPTLSTKVKKDTVKVVDFDGKDMFFMRTVVDSTGEVTVSDVLNAAVISARFRNLAERNGKILIEFQIRVPGILKEKKWQLRVNPVLLAGEDSLNLEQLVVTGGTYREFEALGDKKIQKFESKLATAEGANRRNLESMRGYMYNRYYMPKPEHVRVDTLIRDDYEEYVYEYSYEYQPNPKLRKVDIVVDGEVRAMNDYIYRVPRSDALTFYISSLAFFADETEKYKTIILSRKLEANQTYNIEFAQGKWQVDADFNNNARVIANVEKQLTALLENKVYDLDSIVVTASASPEGALALNRELSGKRSASIADYFDAFMRHKVDSLNNSMEESIMIDVESGRVSDNSTKVEPVPFISRSIPENWNLLDELVAADTSMTDFQKAQYLQYRRTVYNLDEREWAISRFKWYKDVREKYYPKLRAVRFDFNLHRKGMVKDTVHTTILDTAYMDGVQAIKDRDYEKAVELLRPYEDYNTAVAYCALGRNMSALQILENVPQTPQTRYMKAIIYARLDDEEKAIQEYVAACREDRTYISRGNLDPEISTLIRKYNINLLDSEEDDFGW